jgi:hypothetical protein
MLPVFEHDGYLRAGRLAPELRRHATAKMIALWPPAIKRLQRDRQITPETLCEWHGEIWGDLFRADAGHFRDTDGSFEWVRWNPVAREFGPAKFVALPADRVGDALSECCGRLTPKLERFRGGHHDTVPVAEASRCGGWFFARMIRVQPFRGGNESLAFFAMNCAWAAMGLGLHDFDLLAPNSMEALSYALPLSQSRTIIHFAPLLERCLQAAERPPEENDEGPATAPTPDELAETLNAGEMSPREPTQFFTGESARARRRSEERLRRTPPEIF